MAISTNESLPDVRQFDWHCRSPLELPPREKFRFPTLTAMLQSADADEDNCPLLIGADHTANFEITLAYLRRAAFRANEWCRKQGFRPDDSLLLVRLPYSSEIPLAVAAIALMSVGVRVVLPMSFDAQTLAEIIQATNSGGILWCTAEAARHDEARQSDAMLRNVASSCDQPVFSIDAELDWHRPGGVDTGGLKDDGFTEEREVLVLSTSGSTGRPKLVRYTDVALLRVAEAWNAAGLMSPDLTGGRSFCPTLSHSMGFRNVFHAVWNRQPTVLAQPEWLAEQPKKFVKLLERNPPEHITCGPALLSDLALLAKSLQRVRDALSHLRCVVSSGAAQALHDFPALHDARTANAFGMTESQQVLNTLLGPESQCPRALGRPLPGVTIGVKYQDAGAQIGHLFVASPFGAKGYVGSLDFEDWLDTGDLVQVLGDDLIWVGRADEDFLNTGLGVKVSLAEVRDAYSQLTQRVEAVIFVPLSRREGLGALVYVGDNDPCLPELRTILLNAISADHQHWADAQRYFALGYMSLRAIGIVAGRPPRRGPGKVDTAGAMASARDLFEAMDNPSAEHPLVLTIPQFGCDRPDWRRFASPND
jgi:acyl-coenzyme A synthetase/AMP-(fatty) acid ligase